MARVQKRNSTVPAPPWWIAAAAERKRSAGLINAQITERVRVALKLEKLDESRVSRCLTGETTPVPLLCAISRVLGVPQPVFLPATMAEARQLASAAAEFIGAARLAVDGTDDARLASIDADIEAIELEAADVRKRQTRAVGSVDVGRARKRPGGGVGDRRRGVGEA